MKFVVMRKVAWAGVVASLVFTVVVTSLSLILYLPEAHYTTGIPRINYPVTGFWWSLLAVAWTLVLIIPYLAYFLRANGWCAACCGGHQQYHLSMLFSSVVDEDDSAHRPIHPGKKRPLLSKNAKLMLHILMVAVGGSISITSLLCFLCFASILRDPTGATWAFINMLVGGLYLAVIAFVYKQLAVRDHKRKLLASSPYTIRRVLSDSEEAFGRRWDVFRSANNSDYDSANATADDMAVLSDSDTKHLLKQSDLIPTRNSKKMPINEEGDEPDWGSSHAHESIDLDENLIASQLSGHSPFSLSKQAPESSFNSTTRRGLTLFAFIILGCIVITLFVVQCLAVYQVIAMAVDTHLVPPKGQFYSGSENYGYKIHFYCQEKTSTLFGPTILIETEWASVSYEWGLVTHILSTQSGWNFKVCTYDRAGYGWSDPGLKPRDARTSAKELLKVMRDSGIPGPFVLVSNGYGSFISRVLASLSQTERDIIIAAMVMVDALHEDEEHEYFKKLDISVARGLTLHNDESRNLFTKKMLAPLGISRLQIQPSKQLNSTLQRNQLAAMGQLSFADAVWSEFDNMFGLSSQAVTQTRGSGFGSMPITLVVSEYRINGTCEQNRIPSDKCSNFLDARDALGDLPMKLQHNLLTLSSDSQLILAKRSSNSVHLDQPDFLAQVITDTAVRAFNLSWTPN